MSDFIPSGQHGSSAVENREHESGLYARRVVEIPSNQQMRADWNGSKVDYIGFAPKALAESADGWLIHKIEYSGANPSSRTIGSGSWDNRASLTYS